MRIYWWQGGLHLDPESDTDRKNLVKLGDLLIAVGVGKPQKKRTAAQIEAAEAQMVILRREGHACHNLLGPLD
jgi:hypothetical protein